MKLRSGLVAALLACGSAWTPAQPMLPAAVQDEVESALLDYQAGRMDAARLAWQALAQRRVPLAEFNLAMMHMRREVPQPDTALAAKLLQRAADAGFVTAQFTLAQGLENGELGPASRDLVKAHDWYERAAKAGSVDAQVAMGTAFYLGRGRPKDAILAAYWYREAANRGEVGAMYLLASMYEQGDGVALDLRLARHWYAAAARAGDVAAPGKVREIDARLAAQPL